MALVEGHISKVGTQSGDAMKFMLHEFLRERYQSEYPSDFSGKLAAAVANYLFCEHPQREFQSFAIENKTLIESKAKELSQEEPLL